MVNIVYKLMNERKSVYFFCSQGCPVGKSLLEANVPIMPISLFPAGIYLFKINNGNARTVCEICSELAIKTPEPRQWHRSGVFIVNFEQISHIVLVFPLLPLNK